MNHFERLRIARICVLACFVVASGAQAATSLLPFEAPGTTWDERPELAGKVIDRTVQDFSFNEIAGFAIKGSVESLVVRTFNSGTLDFYWRVSVAPDSYWRIARFSSWGGETEGYLAGWLSEGFGTVGGRRPVGYVNGYFDFGFDSAGGGIPRGTQSQYLFMRTDATSYGQTGAFSVRADMQYVPSYQVQSISPSYTTFAPVPEPELYAMVAMALGFAGIATRRRLARSRLIGSESPRQLIGRA